LPRAPIDRLSTLVGCAHVLTGIDCSPFLVDGRTPEAVVFPGSKEEVAAVMTLAAEAEIPVIPWGGGTKMGIGAPRSRPGLILSLRRLDRVLEHEPGDLTATAQAGISLAAFQVALGARGQWLSLDPPHADRATLGGILATGAAGPRRHLYGTARDLLIGLTLVLADGAVVRGGGKVVKNVAGYDLPKLAIGSLGTLGIIVDATFKLRPRPELDRLAVIGFERLKDAGQAARAVMSSDIIPSAVELLDWEALGALTGAKVAVPTDGGALVVGVDGTREQVEWQCMELSRLVGGLGATATRALDGAERDEAWRVVAGLSRGAFPGPAAVMKLGVLPTQVAEVMAQGAAAAQRSGLRAAFAAHAGVGIVSAALAGEAAEAGAVVAVLGEWRAMAAGAGGHALLEWAPLAVKERMPVWDPPGPAHRFMRRIKEQLDPLGILNPGRFPGDS
jgi:glycolate dehydrogenase FAD-binding subunit